MRIALVGPLHPWRGGIAQYLGLLGETLMARAEVRGVTFTRQYPEMLFPGRSQRDPTAPPPRFPVAPLLDSVQPWSWRTAARHLEAFAPGLVLLKWWLPFFGPAFASAVGPLRRRGSRVALVCDNLVPHEGRPFDRAFTRWMLRNSDGYLVMSASVERDLDRLKPGAPRRRVPHPLYAQFDRGRWTRESARARLGLEGEVAVFFGYVRHYKGLDTLLEAWPAVRARRPVTLVVAGEFYEDAAPYRVLASKANASDDGPSRPAGPHAGRAPMGGARADDGPAVRLWDRYLADDEVEALFKAADVAVLPYRSATQSGVTHVAYALGVPVITTDVGGLAETVRPGETGLVVAPEDPGALAQAVVRFFAEGMGPRLREGVRLLQHQHSWEALAEGALDLGDALAPTRGWR